MSGPLAAITAYGSGGLDTQTVTNGVTGTTPNRQWGYENGVMGSISPGTSKIYGGAAILDFYKFEGDGVYLIISGVRSNSGWAQVTIAGSVFTRSAATYTNPGGNSQWYWPLAGTATPFAGSGQTVAVFT